MRALAALALIFAPAPAAALCVKPNVLQSLRIEAETGANQNNATAVDIVYALDAEAAKAVGGLRSVDYFAARPALMSALGNRLVITSLQIPPLSARADAKLDAPCRAVAVYAYASMGSGRGRAVLGRARAGTLRIGVDDLIWKAAD